LGSRRSAHRTSPPSTLSDSLVVTHPFHPLAGQRLPVLFERRRASGRLYICEGGALGSVGIPEAWCDRAPPAAKQPLTSELLADLVRVLAAIEGREGG
jgi:hypothetical protein